MDKLMIDGQNKSTILCLFFVLLIFLHKKKESEDSFLNKLFLFYFTGMSFPV